MIPIILHVVHISISRFVGKVIFSDGLDVRTCKTNNKKGLDLIGY